LTVNRTSMSENTRTANTIKAAEQERKARESERLGREAEVESAKIRKRFEEDRQALAKRYGPLSLG
jgi:hypothetical protein